MRIFVINVPAQKERREFMEKQLQHLGLEYEFIEAVSGEVPQVERRGYEPERAIEENGERLLPGEIGCALSHLGLYERMVEEEIVEAVILEDDVLLPDNFQKMVDKASQSEFAYVTFNYPPVGILRDLLFEKTFSLPRIFRGLLLVPFKIVLKLYEAMLGIVWRNGVVLGLPRPLFLTGAYYIRKSAASSLLSFGQPLRFSADRLVHFARKHTGLRIGAYVPLSVLQAPLGSTIEYERRIRNPKAYQS